MSQAASEIGQTALRIDRWLWYTRFFKTRNSAATAIKGGHVRLNGLRTKPAKVVHIGDLLRIAKGTVVFEVTVMLIPTRRGPAAEATLCYIESEASLRKREIRAAERRAMNLALSAPTKGRPDKRTRRLLRSTMRDRTRQE